MDPALLLLLHTEAFHVHTKDQTEGRPFSRPSRRERQASSAHLQDQRSSSPTRGSLSQTQISRYKTETDRAIEEEHWSKSLYKETS